MAPVPARLALRHLVPERVVLRAVVRDVRGRGVDRHLGDRDAPGFLVVVVRDLVRDLLETGDGRRLAGLAHVELGIGLLLGGEVVRLLDCLRHRGDTRHRHAAAQRDDLAERGRRGVQRAEDHLVPIDQLLHVPRRRFVRDGLAVEEQRADLVRPEDDRRGLGDLGRLAEEADVTGPETKVREELLRVAPRGVDRHLLTVEVDVDGERTDDVHGHAVLDRSRADGRDPVVLGEPDLVLRKKRRDGRDARLGLDRRAVDAQRDVGARVEHLGAGPVRAPDGSQDHRGGEQGADRDAGEVEPAPRPSVAPRPARTGGTEPPCSLPQSRSLVVRSRSAPSTASRTRR